MSWTTPRTWVTSELVTASIMNTHIRDNLNYLFSGIPTCRVYSTSALTISNSSNLNAALPFGAERWDTDTMHSTSSGSYTKISFNTSGYYYVGANVQYDADGTGYRGLAIVLNGSTSSTIAHDTRIAGSSVKPAININTIWPMSVGDYIQVLPQQNRGGNLDIEVGTNYSPEFWAEWRHA